MAKYVLGIDLGGTLVRTALADRSGRLLKVAKEPTRTHEGPDAVIGRILECVQRVTKDVEPAELLATGVAAPGPLDPRTGSSCPRQTFRDGTTSD